MKTPLELQQSERNLPPNQKVDSDNMVTQDLESKVFYHNNAKTKNESNFYIYFTGLLFA